MNHSRFPDAAFSFRHVDDGDHHVYIKTDWLTLVVAAGLLVALGGWLF